MITMNVSGNLTADAIVRTVNNNEVINFSVASNHRYKSKNGELKEETTFMYCQLWNKKEVAELLYKGRGVSVTGYFKSRNYVGGDGVMKTTFYVVVTSFQVFGKSKPNVNPQALLQSEVPDEKAEVIEFKDLPTDKEEDNTPVIIDDLPF